MHSSEFLKAAGHGDRNTMADLIAQGVNINLREEVGRGRTALMKACRHGHISTAELLLIKGARADEQDAAGDTALSYAACNGHMDIVKLLLRQGADTRLRNRAGRTVPEEVGYELLAKYELTDAERAEAQKHFWEFITICRQHNLKV